MSPTGQATSSTSNLQLINDALADYARLTGIDLKDSHAFPFEHSISSEGILELLQRRMKKYQDENQKLISSLGPTVRVLHALSRIHDEVDNLLVPFPLASAIFVGIGTLLDAASGVASSYDCLIDFFECMANFLKRLEFCTMILPTPKMTDMIIKIMVELLLVLAQATKRIQQGLFKKFAKKLLLKDSDIEDVLRTLDRLTQDEARMTVLPLLGVVHGLVGNMKAVMEGGKASLDTIRYGLAAIHQVINVTNKMNRDQLRWDVNGWLSPPDPSTNHNFVRKALHSGTAAWFSKTSVYTEWKAKGSFLWIHGKPGAGKSTLLSAIIQDIKQMHEAELATMVYYYFDFRDVKKQDCFGLLSSLILQLAAESNPCYDILSKFYLDNTRGLQKPDVDALKECVINMLSLPGQAPIYIIVDALDECPNFPRNPSAREEVLKLIEELVKSKLPNLHLCVASRLEIDVRMVLDPLTSLQLSLHDESGQKEDIIAFIESVVRSDRRMRGWRKEDQNMVIDTLSRKANGMFRWVVCQVDILRRCFPANIRGALADLPLTLDETYERTLLNIDKGKKEYAQRLFQCLAASTRPLRVEELADILAVQFDAVAPLSFNEHLRPLDAEKTVLSTCSSLIVIVNREGNKVVQFSHFSVRDYLTSQRLAMAEQHLSYYHILPNHAHTVLAHACLAVLLQLDHKIDKNNIGRFPLASYAARHWVDHAQFGNVSSHIQKAMERLFDPAKPHFAAWVWLYDIDHHWIKSMSEICPTRPEANPLYYASLCGFHGLVKHLIGTHSPDVNSKGGSHTTALHATVVNRHSEVASLLLRYGADPNSRDQLGRAPLHRAPWAGPIVMVKPSFEIAQFLVRYGANVNITDDQGGTPLHAAARCGDHDIAQLLIESRASLDVRNMNQQTPLHVACANGKLEVSRLLINCGSDINAQDSDHFTPLHTVSRFGHADIVRLLLDRGSDVNVCESKRWTPLHYASRKGFIDLARLLIDHGADVDSQEEVGWTALHIASATGDLKITELLIDNGANVDSRNGKQKTPLDLASGNAKLGIACFLIGRDAAVSSRDYRGWTPFHTASYHGHLDVARFLLEHGIDVDIRTGNDETSLYLASSNGKLDVVRFLIKQGANIHVRNNNSWNPVHIASDNGHLDIVQQLIDVGIPVDILNGTQSTPLGLASRKGNVEVGSFLIERGADVNARDKESRVPLHFTAQYGHLEMTRLLLDQGADANVQKRNLWSPLHLASTHGHLKVAELLVHRGARVDVFTSMQETPLHLAAGNGRVEIARLLIDRGANLPTTNSNGWTPLHAASRRGRLELVKLLLCRGADVDGLNKANKTAAELASENGHAEVANFVVAYKSNANIRNKIRSSTFDTAQYGASKDAKNKEKSRTSLHTAAEEGNIDVLLSLLKPGVDINGRNASNQTPLDRASRKGKLNVVRLLIERDADADSRDTWGWTPLDCASRYGHLAVARLLINKGANVNATKHDYWTPIHLSAINGHLEIVKLLIEHGADVHAINDQGETPYQVSLQRGYTQIADLLLDRARAEQGSWYSHQSTNESHSPYNPGGCRVICQQNPLSIAAAPQSQGPAGVQNAWVAFSTTAKKRKALLIGIDYLHSEPLFRLQCCTKDAYSVADVLHDEYGYARNDIRIITDDNPGDLAIKENILEAMKTLVHGAEPGDAFFVYFSGHGIHIKDRDGVESDGLDECICAMDYRGDDPYPDSYTPGLIVDDTMHELMVKPLPPQCRLTAIFDCRHSGTILDPSVVVSDTPDHSPSRPFSPNIPDGRNSNVPDHGPRRGEYSISHRVYHDALQGGTTHTSYGVSHRGLYPQAVQSSSLQSGTPAGYDMAPHASQQPLMGPGPPTEFVPVQSADSPYPLGIVRQQSPRRITLTGRSSQGPAGAWNPLVRSYSHHLTSEFRFPYNSGGFRVVPPQNPQPIAAALPSQGTAGVKDAWVSFSKKLRQPLTKDNRAFVAAEKRKALVIGINYSQHLDCDFKLRYCTRDAYEMASFLSTNFGFAPRDIRVMTDDMENSWNRPTKANILLAMQELVHDPQPGDSFFLYYSGHGVQIEDTNGDEDGLDECICATDYCGDDPYPTADTPGLIVDDVMHDIFVRPLPLGCRFTALFDSCHSGTPLDLPYEYDSNGVVKPFRHPEWLRVLRQKTSYADVVSLSLSISKDNQRTQETHRGGALRYAFIDSMKKFNNTSSYKALIWSVLDYMERHRFQQKPQLSTSYEIDTNLPFIV